jgi:glutathione S-transferase
MGAIVRFRRMPNIRISCFRWVPPFAQGLVRDLRVRWALEEAGLAYEERLLSFEEHRGEAYRKLQPFGQVPIMEVDDVVMFESGAIVTSIAEQSDALMPSDPAGRARVRSWMFAALNTLEPQSGMLNFIALRQPNPGADVKKLRDEVAERVEQRLDAIVAVLGDRAHLVDDRFTAADLLMTTVLRTLRTTDLVTKRPVLAAYVARHEARPAFAKALRAQMANFEANAPKS